MAGKSHSKARNLKTVYVIWTVVLIMLFAFNVLPQTPSVFKSSDRSPPTSPAGVPRAVAQASPLGDSEQVNPYALYSVEPAPMGIADYGIGPGGAYQYSTNSFLGSAYVASLSTRDSSGHREMSIQLNVDLKFSNNGAQYVYWIQDVAQIDTATSTIYFLNNIWNHSGPSRDMNGVALSGSGQIVREAPNEQYFYYCWANSSLEGNGVSLSYPVDIEFRINSTTSPSGRPQVTFEYGDGFGWQEYDMVTFLVNGSTSLSGFVVDGSRYNPYNTFYDAELMLGGAGEGLATNLTSSDVRLQLQYWNGHNYQTIKDAFNFGSDTAEGIGNALSQWYYYPSNGEVYAEVQPGNGTLGKLWDLSGSGIGTIDIKTTYDSGLLYIRNASMVNASPSTYPFTGGEVTVTLEPGYYDLSVFENGFLVDDGNYTLVRGQQLQLSESVPLTVSYSIAGGGSGYSSPTLTYTSHGQVQTATLSASPVTLKLDPGSSWSVQATLSGSSTTERWQANQVVSGTAATIQMMVFVYYHQYYASFGYNVVGGGSGYSAPVVNYTQFGSTLSAAVGPGVWVDAGSDCVYPQVLQGSGQQERWASTSQTVVVGAPGGVLMTYYHQFLLGIAGIPMNPQWYDDGSTATVSIPGVYGRAGGSGKRVASYSVDGSSTTVQPTTGNVVASIQMNATRQLSISSVLQYQVALDAGAAEALVSITPPTVSGDNYWYDAGTPVSVTLNGVWARSSGVGQRLASYTVNGQATPVSSTGPVNVLALSSLASPETVSGTITVQYKLTLAGGSPVSNTAPTVSGDDGWYDSGTSVTIVFNYSWNQTSDGSRLNAVGYSVDQGVMTTLSRSGNRTFPMQVSMTAPHGVEVISVTQYSLTVAGGGDVVLSQVSATGDSFNDKGSTLTITTDYIWNVTNGNTRQNLFSFTLDGLATNVPRAESGNFTTPAVTFNSAHTLSFTPITQYLISFRLQDSSGTSAIMPASFQVESDGSNVINVSQSELWVDNGSVVQIQTVMWENSDVKPVGQNSFAVDSPLLETIRCRVYDAELKVIDYLDVPVSGAQVSVDLANGSTVKATTSSSGTAAFGLIPIGTFKAMVSNLGMTTTVLGDASVRAVTTAKVFGSYVTFGFIAGVFVMVGAVTLLIVRNRHHRGKGGVERAADEE